MSEFWKTVLVGITAFIFGAGGLAIINIIQKRWEMKFDRKAKKEDKAEEKNDKLDDLSKQFAEYAKKQEQFNQELLARVEKLEEQNDAQNEGMRYTLLDRILYLGKHYINDGEVSFDDRKRLGDMHTVYHNRLGGNGDADAIMDGVYDLPLKK